MNNLQFLQKTILFILSTLIAFPISTSAQDARSDNPYYEGQKKVEKEHIDLLREIVDGCKEMVAPRISYFATIERANRKLSHDKIHYNHQLNQHLKKLNRDCADTFGARLREYDAQKAAESGRNRRFQDSHTSAKLDTNIDGQANQKALTQQQAHIAEAQRLRRMEQNINRSQGVQWFRHKQSADTFHQKYLTKPQFDFKKSAVKTAESLKRLGFEDKRKVGSEAYSIDVQMKRLGRQLTELKKRVEAIRGTGGNAGHIADTNKAAVKKRGTAATLYQFRRESRKYREPKFSAEKLFNSMGD